MHGDRNFDRGLGSRPEAARERQRSLPEAEMAPLGGDFSAKVAQANDRIICGSSVDAVKTLPSKGGQSLKSWMSEDAQVVVQLARLVRLEQRGRCPRSCRAGGGRASMW